MSLLGPRSIAAPRRAKREPRDQRRANLRAFNRSKGAYKAERPKHNAEKKIQVPKATSLCERLIPGKQGSGSEDHGQENPLLVPWPVDPRLFELENGLDHLPNQLPGTDAGSSMSIVVLELDCDIVLAPFDCAKYSCSCRFNSAMFLPMLLKAKGGIITGSGKVMHSQSDLSNCRIMMSDRSERGEGGGREIWTLALANVINRNILWYIHTGVHRDLIKHTDTSSTRKQ